MSSDDPQTLVSTQWVADNLKNPDLRIFDGSWHMAASNRDPRAEYETAHLPGARFFDIDDVSDSRSAMPHMAPPVEKFMSRMRALGVGDGHQVVVYDTHGLFSAARVWWLFRLMGQTKIAVMDGGLPKWQAEGRPVTSEPPVIRDRHMTVVERPDYVKDVTQVAHAAKLADYEIIDARSADRFRGDVEEPRPGLRAGHIPGSKNVPFTQLLNADKTMKDPAALHRIFQDAGVDLAKPAITSCGSGITATVLSLALERIGKTDHALYDGSWTEWGQFPTLNVATGDA
ncbi:MAG: 3-mercaptopyruvate sulfurtransferase [Pseudomonadota bacterium]